jgi:serine/threonine-protein kinase/endoribonuclease IRE1
MDTLPEAQELIEKMINFNYEQRPPMKEVLTHIMFWDHEKKLRLIMDLSDHLEFLQTSNPTVRALEKLGREVKILDKCRNDWSSNLDEVLLSELHKYRKYNTSSVSDLLRFIRNKRNHFRDLPPEG